MDAIILKAIKLINIQSWGKAGNTVLEFAPGLNIIKAENQTGKSVLFKTLHMIINPKGYSASEIDDLIRYDCQYGEVLLQFSDDYISYIVFNSKFISYYSYNTEIQDFELLTQSQPPEELIHRLGSINRGSIISNVIEMDESKFLVNTDSQENADLISILIDNPDLDRIISLLEDKWIPENKSLKKEILRDKKYVESELNKYPLMDTTILEEKLKYSESVFNLCNSLIEPLGNLESIKEIKDVSNIQPYVELYDKLSYLSSDSYFKRIRKAKSLSKDYSIKIDLCDSLNLIESSLDTLHEVKEYSTDIKLYLDLAASLQGVQFEFTKLHEIKNVDRSLSLILDLVTDLMQFSSPLSSIVSKGDLVLKKQEILNSLKSNGGVEYDGCPIYGKVIAIGEECIPSGN